MQVTITRTVTLTMDIDTDVGETHQFEAAASWLLDKELSEAATSDQFIDELSSRLGWTLFSASFAYHEPLYRVIYATLHGWESWDVYFTTLDEAIAAISEHIKDGYEEYEAGNISSPYLATDHRIIGNGKMYDHNGKEL